MGMRTWPRLARLLRYATVSAVSTAVGLSTLGILVTFTQLSAGWANVIATVLGTIPSFELNRRWVWSRDDRRSLTRQVLPFGCLALLELAASTLAVHGAATWAQNHQVAHMTRTVIVIGANLTAFGALWVAQYVVCDRLLFRAWPATAGGVDR